MVQKLANAVQRLQLIVPVDWLRRIDAWRRHQPGLPSRSHAIRQLVSDALDAAESGKGDKKPKG
jgi:metal-responsive CopG/Arc/MetJ family transcriptional regulator